MTCIIFVSVFSDDSQQRYQNTDSLLESEVWNCICPNVESGYRFCSGDKLPAILPVRPQRTLAGFIGD